MPSHIGQIDGGTYIACTRGSRHKPCVQCGKPSTTLCDWPLEGAKKRATCDRALCSRCAVSVGPDRDYCGVHARLSRPQPTTP